MPSAQAQTVHLGKVCKANASELGKLGAATRKANFAAQQARLALLDTALARIADLDPSPILRQAIAEAPPPCDAFTLSRLARVRSHLERIDDLLSKETDPQSLDRLAAAASKLEEQERRLSGRSLPVNLSKRVMDDKPRRARGSTTIELLPPPTPIVDVETAPAALVSHTPVPPPAPGAAAPSPSASPSASPAPSPTPSPIPISPAAQRLG